MMFSLIDTSTKLINPFPELAAQHTAGLDAIVTAIGTTPEVSDVADAVFDYVLAEYYPSADAQTENALRATIYEAINGFANQVIRAGSSASVFNLAQQTFIEMILSGLPRTPVDAIDLFLSDIEDNITKSDLSIKEQLPLLMATLTGRSDYAYWIAKVETPGDWSTFFSTRDAVNYANIPHWVAASVAGTLMGARRNEINEPAQFVSISTPDGLASGLAVTAMKVVFKLMPRLQTDLIGRILQLVNEQK
jgi:hypothetical protein